MRITIWDIYNVGLESNINKKLKNDSYLTLDSVIIAIA
jgi:hypothetical protein